ncbi:hypothetical protein SAMN06297422_11072 [Lachnospiraceae bacterium]|nr:hypothetical protein SAMN06297422_11072 [Lachnospiraceae bacterium]
MDIKRAIQVKAALTKAFSIVAVCFSMSIIFIGVFCAATNLSIEGMELVKIWLTFFILGGITFFRIMIDDTQWAKSKPFFVKNIIFMPLYLVVTLIMAVSIVGMSEILARPYLVLLYVLIFLITFTVRQLIGYIIEKAKTDLMNDALESFQKEYSWDEEE